MGIAYFSSIFNNKQQKLLKWLHELKGQFFKQTFSASAAETVQVVLNYSLTQNLNSFIMIS